MKIFYSLLISSLLITSFFQLDAQCTATLKTSSDGKGGYTFQATISDTDSVFTSYWLVDSVVIDSNTLSAAYKFYTNGNHQVCFQYSDTSGCTIDTCKTILVGDAEYHPLLDSLNIWSINLEPIIEETKGRNSNSRSSCWQGLYSMQIYTDGDTGINNLTYKTVYDMAGCQVGFIREDTFSRKIYFLSEDSSQEALLYNFSMRTGDTINLNFTNSLFGGIYYNSGAYRLDSIEWITITAGPRRVFYFNLEDTCTQCYKPALVWVEGLGHLGHPIYLYASGSGASGSDCFWTKPLIGIIPSQFLSFVTCYDHGQKVYFDSCDYQQALQWQGPCFIVEDSCIYYGVCGAINNISILSSFDLSPNPSNGLVTINMQVANSSKFEFAVLDMEGKQMTGTYPLGKLGTGTYNKQIDLSVLPSGFYLVECKTSEGSLYRKLVIAK